MCAWLAFTEPFDVDNTCACTAGHTWNHISATLGQVHVAGVRCAAVGVTVDQETKCVGCLKEIHQLGFLGLWDPRFIRVEQLVRWDNATDFGPVADRAAITCAVRCGDIKPSKPSSITQCSHPSGSIQTVGWYSSPTTVLVCACAAPATIDKDIAAAMAPPEIARNVSLNDVAICFSSLSAETPMRT